MNIEREPDPKGDRVKITMSGRFLPYERFISAIGASSPRTRLMRFSRLWTRIGVSNPLFPGLFAAIRICLITVPRGRTGGAIVIVCKGLIFVSAARTRKPVIELMECLIPVRGTAPRNTVVQAVIGLVSIRAATPGNAVTEIVVGLVSEGAAATTKPVAEIVIGLVAIISAATKIHSRT